MGVLPTLSIASSSRDGGGGVSNTSSIGRVMALRSAHGSRLLTSWTLTSSQLSIGTILTSPVGHQEPSLEGGVLSQLQQGFSLTVVCFLFCTLTPVISDSATPSCSALPAVFIHLACHTPIFLTCSSSAPQYMYRSISLSSLPDCLVCYLALPRLLILNLNLPARVSTCLFGLWTFPFACSYLV